MGEPARRDDRQAFEGGSAFTRADAAASRERILAAAAAMLGDRRVTMAEIAGAANVGRSTLYRHFPTRQALQRALDALASGVTDVPAGEAGLPLGQVATFPF